MPLFSALETSTYRLLALLWTGGIIAVVSVPADSLPRMQTALGYDKIVHIILFGGFGLLWLRSLCPPLIRPLSPSVRWRASAIFAAGILFAGATEVYQQLVPIQRIADPFDAVANLFGLVIAFGGYYVYYRRQTKTLSS